MVRPRPWTSMGPPRFRMKQRWGSSANFMRMGMHIRTLAGFLGVVALLSDWCKMAGRYSSISMKRYGTLVDAVVIPRLQ